MTESLPDLRQRVLSRVRSERRVLAEKLAKVQRAAEEHEHTTLCHIFCPWRYHEWRIKSLEPKVLQWTNYEDVVRDGTAEQLLPVLAFLVEYFRPKWWEYVLACMPSSTIALGIYILMHRREQYLGMKELRERIRSTPRLISC